MRTLTILLTTLMLVYITVPTTRAQSGGTLTKTSLNSEKIHSLETLPYGIIAGEYDTRVWNNPYNGIYISKDLGNSWEAMGLSGRGVTDINYENGLLFATTYYYKDDLAGLFISENRGNTFYQSGPIVSTSSVASSKNTVYLGTYSHGLWVSQDSGQIWEQKLGNGQGWFGPEIYSIEALGSLAIASTAEGVYISKNYGESWEEIIEISDKQVRYFSILGDEQNIIIAGTQNYEGMWKSTDCGNNWYKIESWGDYPVSSLINFKNTLYAQKIDSANNDYSLYISTDFGENWQKTTTNPGRRTIDATSLFAYPSNLYYSLEMDGVHQHEIPQINPTSYPFLAIPWTYNSNYELIDKITAYFDHQYPLGKYLYLAEPSIVENTTLNFLGFEEATPLLFYSGHNGVDFALPYGTQILAPASGFAKYYFCEGCGHSIKINHGNGYETTYMHLQKAGLVTLDPNDKKWVEKGAVIGLVGMTGNTSGPHLHLSVLYDKNLNGVFDDYPDGLIDPFGWHDPYNVDPWKQFSWLDYSGLHEGTESTYLWLDNLEKISTYLTRDQPTVQLDNKTITFSSQDLEKNALTAILLNFIKPSTPLSQFELEYIEGTSFSVKAFDHYEKDIVTLDGEVELTIDFREIDLKGVAEDSLKIFIWNSILKKWEPLPTIIDYINKKATATTTHLSHFALFGEKQYPFPPESSLIISGEESGGWYLDYPEITIQTVDYSSLGIKRTFYSTNKGVDWYIYQNPFFIDQDGIITLYFRSEDMAGNLEETQEKIFKIDTLFRWKNKIEVKDANFNFSQ